jgi:hypothetical protein
MSSDQLCIPKEIQDYPQALLVTFKYDDVEIRRQQPMCSVTVPDNLPVDPLIILQRMDNGHKPVGTTYAYDYEREEFITYDERLHSVPKSCAPVDVGAKSRQLDMSASSKVELSSEAAPTLEHPPSESDEELDEPSCDESPLGRKLDLGAELSLDDED